MPELKKGYSGPEYYRWYDWAKKYASSYAFLLGNRDGYFGIQEDAFVREMQRRMNESGVSVVIDGIFGDRMAAATGYRFNDGVPVVRPRRKIWIYTFPGSGADFWWGPSHDLGVRCKDILNLNHQPVSFQKGGYLGALGGDPKFSYIEVTWDQCKSLEWLLDNNADAQEAFEKAAVYARAHGYSEFDKIPDSFLAEIASQLEFEFHMSGYSQSADGGEDAAEWLFGDAGFVHPGDKNQVPSSGKYRLLRHCLKRVVQFGNPSTKGTGIARKIRPQWLDDKIRNVNKKDDFYAVVPKSDTIRPAFYAIIIKAELELPFGVHVLRIALPIVMKWASTLLPFLAPLLGGFGPMVQMGIGAIGGLQGLAASPVLGGLANQAATDKDKAVDDEIIRILSPMGLLSSIPALIGLLAALPGLQSHGAYGPADIDQAYAHIAGFRR